MSYNDIKTRIKQIDNILDSNITDQEYNLLESEARELTLLLAEIEKEETILNLPKINANTWFLSFLDSFNLGTSIISKKQYDIIRKNSNNNNNFIVNTYIINIGMGKTFGHIIKSKYNKDW